MSFDALANSIRTAVLADTGSGGVFETAGTYKVTGCWTDRAPDETALPYLTVSSVSEVPEQDFDGEFVRHTVQINVWSDGTAGGALGGGIMARLKTIFSRVALTVSGYGTPVGLLEGTTTNDIIDETRHHFLTLRYDLEAQ